MKKIILLLIIFAGAISAIAQPAISGTSLIEFEENNASWKGSVSSLAAFLAAGGGTVASVTVTNANGLNGTVANSTSTPNITLSTTVSGMVKGNGTAFSAATSGTDYSAGTSALATGILKSTTTTGALTIATAGDFPTLNQSTTGSAATLGTTRNIHGGSFNGSADVTNVIASTFGGTGNGFTKFTGATTAEKTYTLPNASATILTNAAAVTAAQGGTGQTTYAVGDILYASTSSALSKLADIATGNALITGGVGVAPSYGKIGLATHVSGTLPISNGGTNVTAVGADVTLFGSNGSANIYYTLARTNVSAAIGWTRSTSTLNFNLPDADASFPGIVSTGTQTMAGAKTFSGAVTVQGLATESAGSVATATASVAAYNAVGVEDASHIAVASNTTLDHTHNVVAISTLTADITLTLPACNATRDGWKYTFFKDGTDIFAAIIDPNAAETFTDGATTKSLYSAGNNASCKCRSSDSKWYFSR
jgi:hypothetical protein